VAGEGSTANFDARYDNGLGAGSADAFGPFAALLRQHFPVGTQVNLPNDNPFPPLDPAVWAGPESLGGVGNCDRTCHGG